MSVVPGSGTGAAAATPPPLETWPPPPTPPTTRLPLAPPSELSSGAIPMMDRTRRPAPVDPAPGAMRVGLADSPTFELAPTDVTNPLLPSIGNATNGDMASTPGVAPSIGAAERTFCAKTANVSEVRKKRIVERVSVLGESRAGGSLDAFFYRNLNPPDRFLSNDFIGYDYLTPRETCGDFFSLDQRNRSPPLSYSFGQSRQSQRNVSGKIDPPCFGECPPSPNSNL